MKKLVLDRLVTEIRAPMESLARRLDTAQELLRLSNAERDRLREENKSLTKGQLPFSDLYRAADRVVKTTGVARRKALTELKAAMKVANDHIDWIPF
jgi:transposase-like protein